MRREQATTQRGDDGSVTRRQVLRCHEMHTRGAELPQLRDAQFTPLSRILSCQGPSACAPRRSDL